jgi:adenosylmethionine-8-amino-7-oxononanoate aminotransferase
MAELVKDKQSGEPFCDRHQPLNEPLLKLNETLLENGLSTLLRGSRLLNAPPLIIKPRELEAGLEIIDKALYVTDRYARS